MTAASTKTAMKFLLRRIARGSGVAPAGAGVSVIVPSPASYSSTVLRAPSNQTQPRCSESTVDRAVRHRRSPTHSRWRRTHPAAFRERDLIPVMGASTTSELRAHTRSDQTARAPRRLSRKSCEASLRAALSSATRTERSGWAVLERPGIPTCRVLQRRTLVATMSEFGHRPALKGSCGRDPRRGVGRSACRVSLSGIREPFHRSASRAGCGRGRSRLTPGRRSTRRSARSSR